MRTDPLVKFHRVTGRAAAVLRALEQVEQQRVEAQRRVRELEELARQVTYSRTPERLAALPALRAEVTRLIARGQELLAEAAVEAQREQVLVDALKSRGML